ncbi:MAG: hypothetical protein ACOYMD_04275 [Paludibacter sp.]
MKKIYFIVSLALVALFTSCEDYNAKNFPELDLEANPVNMVTISYDMTATDFTSIATIIKKPVTDSITTNTSSLTKAKADLAKIKTDSAANKSDTTALNTKIDALNTEIARLNGRLSNVAIYLNATKIDQNKYFDEKLKAKDYIPYLLAQKFQYLDANSSIKVTYDLVNSNDTTSINTANKIVLTDADYLQMGSATNQPGKSLYFSPAMNIMYYLNLYLKSKFPYAAANEVKMLRYKFNSATTIQYRILTFNGTDWKCANSQFALKKGLWQDILILKGLNDGIGDFKAISIVGDQMWEWNSYKYMLMTGYVSSSKSYFDNEDWLVSPAMNFTERVNPWLNFTHVGRYFNAGAPSLDAMKKAITIWISIKGDGVTINPADWTQLTIPSAGYPSGLNWTFIPSTGIDLSSYAGKSNVRIAFKYLSSAADAAAGSWEIKNVLITEE